MYVLLCLYDKLNQIPSVSRTQQNRQRNLVLRHTVPHFSPSSGAIACWVAKLNAAIYLDTRAKKSKYKYFISSIGNWTHTQSLHT